jgi:hypothetical protein
VKNATLGPCLINVYKAGSIPARDLNLHFSQLFRVRLINVNKFPLDNFHLQYPSTIIQTSEIPTKS